MAPMTWLLRRVRWAGLGLIVAASLGIAVGMLVVGPAFAAGETGGSPTEPTGTGTSNCPSSNPPNQMTLVAGTPQTAILQSAFASGLQVALSNSDGCPVTTAAAGVPVTFSAPSGGASGVFSTSGTNSVIVGADSSGAIMAPTFTANGIAGSYTVAASSQYGSVSFVLTNTAAGTPARLVAVSPVKQTATVAGRYREALAVKVLDGDGNPVAGASVTFTLTASTGSSACGTSSSSSAAPPPTRASPAAPPRRARRATPPVSRPRRPSPPTARRGRSARARRWGAPAAANRTAAHPPAASHRPYSPSPTLRASPRRSLPASAPRSPPRRGVRSRSGSPSPSPTRRRTPSRARW